MLGDSRQALAEVNDSRKRQPPPQPNVSNGTTLNVVFTEEGRVNDADVINTSNDKLKAGRWEKANGAFTRHKSTPKAAQTRVTIGMRLKRWIITGRIGAGSFGETFTAIEEPRGRHDGDEENEMEDIIALSHSSLTSPNLAEVCIKVEQDNKNVLRIEAAALKKIQRCPQVVRYLASGNTGGMNFLVMERLGPNLAELRRGTPFGTFTHFTTLKLGISCLRAIRCVHQLGLIHRDIKPSNFVIGLGGTSDPRTCYLIDFGLARRYRRANGDVRPPRENAGFRGTSRYASLASHRQQELGRVDDIWSLLFMLVEFATGTLPWRKYKEKEEIGRCKEEMIGSGLVQNMPREFRPFLAHIRALHYEDEPAYDFLLSLLERAIERRGYPPDKNFDWEHEDDTLHHMRFHGDGGVTKRLVREHNDAADNSAGGMENSIHKPISCRNASQTPLDIAFVPVPEAININTNRCTSAACLMPPSPRTEEEAEEQGRIGVSDVIVSAVMSRNGDLNDGNHALEAVGALQWNVSSATPNVRADTSALEDKMERVGIERQRRGYGVEHHEAVEKLEVVNLEGSFSPRERVSSMGNSEQVANDAPLRTLPLNKGEEDNISGLTSPRQQQQEEHNAHEIASVKRVSFATDANLVEDTAVTSRRGADEPKEKKKRANCECSVV
ncbi:putative casein kinase [Trypanosoma rangeli]|uniref:non-specific serine/threonine protein kinase n=1 Tax=Trypanosoma rangeli TaxID=5698 RepID=A0A3R7K1Y6_TRYRA|nr:putative casein kinase [Trypanosoma rangeli]RNF00383.1 putative casein kinase [Trypanosoma rangeli]|eukprot:RNF00383.1 putative casein kinase [Trypanosoma rangeli]